jgi:hypothetical protein
VLSLRKLGSLLLSGRHGGEGVPKNDKETVAKKGPASVEPLIPRGNHVLIVGSTESANVIRYALLGEPKLTISNVTNYRELWTIPNQEIIHLVILNSTLSTFELEASGRLIRRRWPGARILVVRQGEGFLEDALYDDRVTEEDSPEVLRGRIRRLLVSRFDRSLQDAR